MLEEEILEIYVDGSVTKHNGGIGARIILIDPQGNEVLHEFSDDGYCNFTSTKMEIVACASALFELQKLGIPESVKRVLIYTDAKYVADYYREAMFHWVGHGWKMRSGNPAPDREQWKDLTKQLLFYKKELGIIVEIIWKKGHNNNPHNNMAHLLARNAARTPMPKAPKRKIFSVNK